VIKLDEVENYFKPNEEVAEQPRGAGMKIELVRVKVRDLVKNFEQSEEKGVLGYNGKLNIRPPYQREFIYKDPQKKAVIQTVFRGYPLNTLYWAEDDGNFEVIDGQQRILSICEYHAGNFSVQLGNQKDQRNFHNLTQDEKDKILDYELMVYQCTGTTSEKLAWFETINIAGEKLTTQELRNAVYSGTWVTAARKEFSKNNCAAYRVGNKYLKGSAIRQEYLETAIEWINDGKVAEYMAKHQNDANADELWNHFEAVIKWVKQLFPTYRKEMKGLNWGGLYKQFKDHTFDPVALEAQVKRLMEDEEVQNKKGIYSYVLDGKEKHLNRRTFSDQQKREAYERQGGVCPVCSKKFNFEEMEGDHITAWSKGGKTTAENCQMLCKDDNRTKSDK
jgi:hypothetical protein